MPTEKERQSIRISFKSAGNLQDTLSHNITKQCGDLPSMQPSKNQSIVFLQPSYIWKSITCLKDTHTSSPSCWKSPIALQRLSLGSKTIEPSRLGGFFNPWRMSIVYPPGNHPRKSPSLIGNTSSIRVHFPASYVGLPECNMSDLGTRKCRLVRDMSVPRRLLLP